MLSPEEVDVGARAQGARLAVLVGQLHRQPIGGFGQPLGAAEIVAQPIDHRVAELDHHLGGPELRVVGEEPLALRPVGQVGDPLHQLPAHPPEDSRSARIVL